MKGLTDKKPAAALLVLMVATGVIPNMAKATVDAPTTTVGRGHHESIELDRETRLEFTAPDGWQRVDRASKDDVAYLRDGGIVRVSATKSIDHLPTAITRKVQSAALDGEHLHLEEQTRTTAHGFTGKYGVTANRNNSRQGRCALVGQDQFMIVVTSTADHGTPAHDITPLVDSLTVKATK
ncbi:hypothetical protein SAMN05421595_0113 [Austwickia chelonae]|uniref:Uncharacterized protein n=1 Tax=Austwickia chelonae NBRC 105200 TaxID=1184607 RepID=K6WAN1_9MICO|nr:hypothetical protein [Austwickia chelonae]GAB78902.1 hypothetical protein AUCHE_17_01140 [Austwickia chelonae NBRC 105200]SEV86188.1 hypothetical protein SAMN05421595_0113 [Austwickia chelonae]